MKINSKHSPVKFPPLPPATKTWWCVDTPRTNARVMQKPRKVWFGTTFQTEIEWSELSQGNNGSVKIMQFHVE